MYALEGLDLGAAKLPSIQSLQKKIAKAQKVISSLSAKLPRQTKPASIHNIQAQLEEWQKRLTDYQLQLSQLQVGIAPPATPTTPAVPPAPVTQTLIPWDLAPAPTPTTTVQVSPAPAPAVSVPVTSDLLSNPWLIGGAAILIFLMVRR